MTIILYRKGVAGSAEDYEELQAIRSFRELILIHQRASLMHHPNSIVIPRYAIWPFTAETLTDVLLLGSNPINDRRSSQWLRRCGDWAADLKGITPDTWSWDEYTSQNISGPVVLKGAEKSFGHKWKSHMYASNRFDAINIYLKLMQDSAFSQEEIFVRRYEPLASVSLKKYSDIDEPPCTEEFRFFVLDGTIIASGFYWSSQKENIIGPIPDPSSVPNAFLQTVIECVREAQPELRLWVMDIARTAKGPFMVVELNDGCSAGLSDIPPMEYYGALAKLC